MRVRHGNISINVPVPVWAGFTGIYPRHDPRHRLIFSWYLGQLGVSPEVEHAAVVKEYKQRMKSE